MHRRLLLIEAEADVVEQRADSSLAVLENRFQVLSDLELDLLGAVLELKDCQCRVQTPLSHLGGLATSTSSASPLVKESSI